MTQLINEFGMQLAQLILTLVVSYVCIFLKNIYKKIADTDEKRNIVKICVQATEQIFKELHGDMKKDKAIDMICDMLHEKGITISEVELDTLIEAAVQEINKYK